MPHGFGCLNTNPFVAGFKGSSASDAQQYNTSLGFRNPSLAARGPCLERSVSAGATGGVPAGFGASVSPEVSPQFVRSGTTRQPEDASPNNFVRPPMRREVFNSKPSSPDDGEPYWNKTSRRREAWSEPPPKNVTGKDGVFRRGGGPKKANTFVQGSSSSRGRGGALFPPPTPLEARPARPSTSQDLEARPARPSASVGLEARPARVGHTADELAALPLKERLRAQMHDEMDSQLEREREVEQGTQTKREEEDRRRSAWAEDAGAAEEEETIKEEPPAEPAVRLHSCRCDRSRHHRHRHRRLPTPSLPTTHQHTHKHAHTDHAWPLILPPGHRHPMMTFASWLMLHGVCFHCTRRSRSHSAVVGLVSRRACSREKGLI